MTDIFLLLPMPISTHEKVLKKKKRIKRKKTKEKKKKRHNFIQPWVSKP